MWVYLVSPERYVYIGEKESKVKKVDKYEAGLPKYFITPYGKAVPYIPLNSYRSEEEYSMYGGKRCTLMEHHQWAETLCTTGAKFTIIEVSDRLIPYEVSIGDIVVFMGYEVHAVYDGD